MLSDQHGSDAARRWQAPELESLYPASAQLSPLVLRATISCPSFAHSVACRRQPSDHKPDHQRGKGLGGLRSGCVNVGSIRRARHPARNRRGGRRSRLQRRGSDLVRRLRPWSASPPVLSLPGRRPERPPKSGPPLPRLWRRLGADCPADLRLRGIPAAWCPASGDSGLGPPARPHKEGLARWQALIHPAHPPSQWGRGLSRARNAGSEGDQHQAAT